MADAQFFTHQPVAGVGVGKVVTVTDKYSAWLIANGYGTPEGGNAGGTSGLDNTSVAAVDDPTLAAVRGVPGSESDLVALGQVRIDKAGSLDTAAKGRGKGFVDSQTNQDSFTAIKGT